MGATALKKEAYSWIDKLPQNKLSYLIQFSKFLYQQDSFDNISAVSTTSKHLSLGFLKDKAKVQFSDDWEITEEELLGL